MVRRVCIGRLPDGNYGMWCSAPGVDVMTVADPLDGNLLTFNSNWTDIAKVHQTGVASEYPGAPQVSWPDLGYIPFLEVRVISGGRVYDDSFSGLDIGPASRAFSNGMRAIGARAYPGMLDTFDYIYVAYKIPVPSG